MKFKTTEATKFKYPAYTNLATFITESGDPVYRWRTGMDETTTEDTAVLPEQVEGQGLDTHMVPEVRQDDECPVLETVDDKGRRPEPDEQDDNVSVPGYNFIAVETY